MLYIDTHTYTCTNKQTYINTHIHIHNASIKIKKAIELRPDFAIAHGNMASCHFDMGDMNSAVKSYKHAIQLEPNFPDA